jgi:hypothetical protein
MPEPTLLDTFGPGASQDADSLMLDKADLTGLTPSAVNSAESLLVAILNKTKETLTPANFESNEDQSVVITEGFQSIVLRGENNYQVRNLNVALYSLLPTADIDPNIY